MNKLCFTWCFLTTWVLSALGAQASMCVTSTAEASAQKPQKPAPQYKVHVAYDKQVKKDVIVELSLTGTEVKDFILDDTGYLGAHLALVRLVQAANERKPAAQTQKSSSSSDHDQVKKFLKERLKQFKTTLMPFDNGLEFSKKLKEMDDLLDAKTLVSKDLTQKWGELQALLQEKELQILARRKPASTQEWPSQETHVSELNLPALPFTVGHEGCAAAAASAEISEFKLK